MSRANRILHVDGDSFFASCEIALNPGHPWISDDVVLLVAPNYNADGNDDMGPNDERRRGQIGPERMGNRPSSRATP